MKKTLFLLLALLLLLLPGCKHRQPAPTDIQVLRQGSLAPADDDTTPVVYVSVRDQSRHVFGLRAEVERLLLQNVGSRNARGSSQMRTGLLAHREFSVDSGVPALFVTLLAREITSPFSTAPQEQAPAQPQDERRP